MSASSAFPPAVPAAAADAAYDNVTAARRSLIDNLYCELLVLADDARAGVGDAEAPKDALLRIRTACESLRLTSFVLQLLQWLVELRAGMTGSSHTSVPPPSPPDWQQAELADLPIGLRHQIDVAIRLAYRASHLAAHCDQAADQPVPHALFKQLQQRFG